MFPAHRAARGTAGLTSPVTVGPLPTPSRVVVSAMGLLSVEHWRRCYEAVCVPSSFHRVLILPPLTASPLRVLRRRGKSCHSLGNYIARVWSPSAKHRTHFLFQLLEKRQGWLVASECM